MIEIIKRLYKFFLSLLPTLIGVGLGVYLGVYSTNKNNEAQDKKTVLHLVEMAKIDTDQRLGAINSLENMMKENQKSDDNNSIVTLDAFKVPGQVLPYPIVFEKVIDDERVLRHVSLTGLTMLYSSQQSLEAQKAYIMDPNMSYADKIFTYKNYKENLQLISEMLGNEIKYIECGLSENSVLDLYQKKERELYGFTEEEYASLIKEE